jgi:hypothetical protein
MKGLIKKLLKEEEFKMESFFVPMSVLNGREHVLQFSDNYDGDHDEYGRFYLNLWSPESFTDTPSRLTKLSYPNEKIVKANIFHYIDEFTGYNDEFGMYTQDELTDYKNENYSQWVEYSGFNVDENRYYMEILDKSYIVEYHTSIVRADQDDMISNLTNL